MAPNQKVAMLLAPGFEDSEFRVPYERLDAAGFRVEVIGAIDGERLEGKKGVEAVVVDRAIDDADADDYVALVIPGGKSPANLRGDERFLDFVRAFDASGRPLAAVCHGPQLLISAGLVEGRTMTSWPSVRKELADAGAHVMDQPVVRDGNWITSRGPDDLNAFSDAIEEAISAWNDRNLRERIEGPAALGERSPAGERSPEADAHEPYIEH